MNARGCVLSSVRFDTSEDNGVSVDLNPVQTDLCEPSDNMRVWKIGRHHGRQGVAVMAKESVICLSLI